MPQKKSYTSCLAHIKDIVRSLTFAIDELDQKFSGIAAEAQRFQEIKPLLDKLAPPLQSPLPEEQLPAEPKKTLRFNRKVIEATPGIDNKPAL